MTPKAGHTFTAGPWKADGSFVRQDCGDRLGPAVARVAGPEGATDPECNANAHLLASAPLMLATLQQLYARMPKGPDREAVRAAIAKATAGGAL